jgi:hypothetical protein
MKDILDIKAIIESEGSRLNLELIRNRLSFYRDSTDEDEPLRRLERLWEAHENGSMPGA